MTLQCTVDGQLLRCQNLIIIEKSVNYLEAAFSFSEDWDDLIKTAQFVQGETFRQIILEDNQCVVPWEVLAHTGSFLLTVFGINQEGDDIRLVTCNGVVVRVLRSGFVEGQTPVNPTPGVDEYLLSQCVAAMEAAQQYAKDAGDSATAAATSEDNAAGSERAAKASETAAGESEAAAKRSEEAAASSERNASDSASAALQSKNAAVDAKDRAAQAEDAAAGSARDAHQDAVAAAAARQILETTPHFAYDEEDNLCIDYGEAES